MPHHSRSSKGLFYTTLTSGLLALIVLVLSLLDFGQASLFILPVTAGLTLVHHAVVLGLSRFRRTAEPYTALPTLILVSILAVAYAPGFLFAVLATAGRIPSDLFFNTSGASMPGTVGFEAIAALLEFAVLLMLLVQCVRQRLEERRFAPSGQLPKLVSMRLERITWVVLFFSLFTYVFSIFDLGFASSLIFPVVPMLTAIELILVLSIHHAHTVGSLTSYAHLGLASALALAHVPGLVFAGMSAQAMMRYRFRPGMFGVGSPGTIIAECVCATGSVLALGTLVVMGMRARRQHLPVCAILIEEDV